MSGSESYTWSDAGALWEAAHGEPGAEKQSAVRYLDARLAGRTPDQANDAEAVSEEGADCAYERCMLHAGHHLPHFFGGRQ